MDSKYDKSFIGLENKGKNNCFLKVVIQSLWHLASFRENFVASKPHKHTFKETKKRIKISPE